MCSAVRMLKRPSKFGHFDRLKTVSKRSIRSIRAPVLPLTLFLRNWLFVEMLENVRFWGKLFYGTSYNRNVQSVHARPLGNVHLNGLDGCKVAVEIS